jgi:hypothetical protein
MAPIECTIFAVIGSFTIAPKFNCLKTLTITALNCIQDGGAALDYAMIEFVSDDGTIATCPAMILGFVQYNITLGIPTQQFTGEEELSLNTIQENMAVDNNPYVVVHTASDYVSSEQLEKEFVSLFILGDVMG